MPTSQVIIQQQDESNYRFQERDFDLAYWHSRGGAEALHGGRGASQKIEVKGQQLVLRRYLRGGLVARLLHDQYLWTGLDNSRPFTEQQVTRYAQEQGLPVADVVAFCLWRKGFYYRAAIITRFIPNLGTLAELCGRDGLAQEQWIKLGRLIRKMHACGINHADLNANNILCDDSAGFHLIDFDKARIQNATGSWAEGNVKRLKRSLDKIKSLRVMNGISFLYSEQQWQAFLNGYRK